MIKNNIFNCDLIVSVICLAVHYLIYILRQTDRDKSLIMYN